ncbi:MAG: thiamine pyrophosphate-dependent enzyme [candidate division WOR-3 bacterium]
METKTARKHHPSDGYLCSELFPSVWCPGCGIGTVVYSFLEALREAGVEPEQFTLLTGSGCTGSIADYVTLNTKRADTRFLLDQAADIVLAQPESRVVVFMNNADLLISGAEDLARAGKRHARIIVIHINNIMYVKTREGLVANTPYTRPSWDGRFELPFNIPALAIASGASYVARWTPLHAGWLKYSIVEAFSKKGLAFIETVSPCVLYEGQAGHIGDAVARIKLYDDHAVMNSEKQTTQFDIKQSAQIMIGEIVDRSAS